MTLPASVKLVEVGPRDGLQNETRALSVELRIELIQQLAKTGLSWIEAGSFVSPRRVPQMASTDQVIAALLADPAFGLNTRFPVLVPNLRGLEDALACGARDIAVFVAASETFSQHNINCSIGESLERSREICRLAAQHSLQVRAYISCVVDCPYQGEINPVISADISDRLLEMGCFEISLGDTTGAATPGKTRRLIDIACRRNPIDKFAVHFHNTYGQALANILVALQQGVTIIDSSIAGLGGCPYAPGASGNVATEDVLYMLDGMGITSNVSMDKLLEVSHFICQQLQREPASAVAKARSKAKGVGSGG